MWIHISSGRGPLECELAVTHFYEYLCKRYEGRNEKLTLLEWTEGGKAGIHQSIVCSAQSDAGLTGGSILWICKSPYRKNHKRKNWFIDVSILPEPEKNSFSLDEVRIETKRSSGKGGQHVNKTESAVRITHISTGIVANAGEERSQLLNKKLALARLTQELEKRKSAARGEIKKQLRERHDLLERGNPVMTFAGPDFIFKK